jgi:alkylhydroperoxidase family enzyme
MDIRHADGVKVGVPAEKLGDVVTYRGSPRFNERERAALEFCERITRDDLGNLCTSISVQV